MKGYDFMFKEKKKLLSKQYMYNKYYDYDRNLVYSNKQNFIDFLNQIEEEFYCHDFKRDDRYVWIGRHKFLIKEMQELYYTKKQCEELSLFTCPTVWCLDSLLEIIMHPNFITRHEIDNLINSNKIYSNKNLEECHKIFKSYNDDGIISLNERDYILHALNMIKDSLDKCNDNLEWN
jgi:hypothetical protein